MAHDLPSRYTQYCIEHSLSVTDFDHNAIAVVEELETAGFEAFLVGGCVRDLITGITPKDFDVATNATPEQVCKHLRRTRIIGRRFKIVHARRGKDQIEITTFRGHVKKHQQQASASGRLLRDNQYGSIKEDAERRDFTINALYYHPGSNSVLDFCDAVRDIRAKTLRVIGEPNLRYQEDPVRMLRAIRFAVKLDFALEPTAATDLRDCVHHLQEVPAARLFDELIKLFINGNARATFQQLETAGLLTYLLPKTMACIANDDYNRRFVELALRNTDQRIRAGKHIAPAFLYATLLWPVRRQQLQWYEDDGMTPTEAQFAASRQAIELQAPYTQIPKRFGIPIAEIWDMQWSLEHRPANRCSSLLEKRRFRAGYDFLLLRNEAGEALAEQCEWWTTLQQLSTEAQAERIEALPKSPKKRRKPRRRRYLAG